MPFSLPTGLVADYQDFVGSFVTDFGSQAKVIYPSFETPCDNCIVDTINHCSTNQYNGTGPVSFPAGSICPWCKGVGFKVTESSDTVKLRLYYKPTDWLKLGIPIEKAKGMIRVRGLIEDFPKLQRCEYLEINDVTQLAPARYQPFGELVPYGLVEKKYFWGFWQKV